MAPSEIECLRIVSARLLACLLGLISILSAMFLWFIYKDRFASLPVVMTFGALGAFISYQRRLRSLTVIDLELLKASLNYTWLAPMSGAVLAGLLFLVFISGMVEGALFPDVLDGSEELSGVGMAKLFEVELKGVEDYAKLLVWSFVAGYSERFVTDILGGLQPGNGRNLT